MAAISNDVMTAVRSFITLVRESGLPLEKAFLFGSYAKGQAHTWSDIDLALVSRDFTGMGFYERRRLNPFLIKTDSRLELHPFRPDEFTKDNPFVEEILRQGVEIEVR